MKKKNKDTIQPVSGTIVPRFAGPSTFARLPELRDVESCDVAIVGIPFDADKDWDEKRQQWSISGEIYNTHNITQSTKGDKDGKWTTVFAAAVLLV